MFWIGQIYEIFYLLHNHHLNKIFHCRDDAMGSIAKIYEEYYYYFLFINYFKI